MLKWLSGKQPGGPSRVNVWRKVRFVVAVVAMLSIITVAFAQTSRSSRRGDSGRSGEAGSSRKDVNVGDNNGRHLYGLRWSERSDKPCYVDIFSGAWKSGKFDPVTGRDGESESECKQKGTSMKEINFGAPSSTTFWAVNGIKVCLNAEHTRVKGITLSALKVQDGKLTTTTTTKTEERTNCKDWMSMNKCPSGQIASELYFDYTNGAIIGISLGCSEWSLQ